MQTLHFDLNKPQGGFKPLNAVNGGPWHKRHATDQWRTNLDAYRKARIPYSRCHDASLSEAAYGGAYGPQTFDITEIFPDFDADETLPESYNFACTDEAILVTLDAGTETFYRLGESIEHDIKKIKSFPPKDFKKWAVICEHVIRHYNEGWANGYYLNIKYWEIWNEPDLDPDDREKKRTWGGTWAQFYDFYEIAAKHLKSCFPELKIGGPSLAFREDWADNFLCLMQQRNVPIDFFSWHIYSDIPEKIVQRAERIQSILDKYGYGNAESILGEFNYIKDWHEGFINSIKSIHGIKGASFLMATMSAAQRSPIGMMMYYDTRPSPYCGAFDFYTAETLKGYYPLYWYGMLYDMKAEIVAENEIEDIYSLCGVDENGKLLAIITHYSNDDSKSVCDVCLDIGRDGEFEIYVLDADRDGTMLKTTKELQFSMPVHSCILIKEK